MQYLVLIEIKAKKLKNRDNLRSGRVINKDFKKISVLDNLKKSSQKDIDIYGAILST